MHLANEDLTDGGNSSQRRLETGIKGLHVKEREKGGHHRGRGAGDQTQSIIKEKNVIKGNHSSGMTIKRTIVSSDEN